MTYSCGDGFARDCFVRTCHLNFLVRRCLCRFLLWSGGRYIILAMFECLHFPDYPKYSKDMLHLRSGNYFSRGQNTLFLPKRSTTSYGIISLSYFATKSGNSLPDHYRTFQVLRGSLCNSGLLDLA